MAKLSLKYTIKKIIKLISPPVLIHLLKYLIEISPFVEKFPIEWEYIPEGWQAVQTVPEIKGWNVSNILDVYQKKWEIFKQSVKSQLPFGLSPEAVKLGEFDLIYHNTLMVFAYCLTLATRKKNLISMLDWGGGIGHYYLLAKALVPDVVIKYASKDVAVLTDFGRLEFPEAHFFNDEKCLDEKYDFVLASASLHYSEDWQRVLSRLMAATDGYLLVTRLPVVLEGPAYVYVQRPYQYGYNTEYLSWAINRSEFLEAAAQNKMRLVREFITGEVPNIHKAPQPCEYRAFLFAPENRDSST